jgi:predicted DNA-binding transcriptional regulator AlpA
LVDVLAEQVARRILEYLSPLGLMARSDEPSLRRDDQSAGLHSPAPPFASKPKRSATDSETHGVDRQGHADGADGAEAEKRGLLRNDQLRILRPAAAAKKLGISKTTLYRWEESGVIPSRIKLSAHAVGWHETALDDFLRSRPAAREASPCHTPTPRNGRGQRPA